MLNKQTYGGAGQILQPLYKIQKGLEQVVKIPKKWRIGLREVGDGERWRSWAGSMVGGMGK